MSGLEGVVTAAIWDELERQADRFGYVDRESGIVDSGVDMDNVAAAVISALQMQPEWSTAYEKQDATGVWRDERTGSLHKSLVEANLRMQQVDPSSWIRNMRTETRLVSPWVVVDRSTQ